MNRTATLAGAVIGGGLLTLAVVPIVLVSSASSAQAACTINAAGGNGGPPAGQVQNVTLDQEQMTDAGTIVATTHQFGYPQQVAAIALMTAMQESSLVNLPGGDLDSAGLFQQRPSQGWGSYAQVTDPVYATTAFETRLVQVPLWQQLQPWQAAQAVQRSGDGTLYAKWTAFGATLAAQLWPLQDNGGTTNGAASLAIVPAPQTLSPVSTPAGTAASSPAPSSSPTGAPPLAGLPGCTPTPTADSAAAQNAIAIAEAQIGKPYQWGATGPDSFDCSGLVQYAYAAAGVALPRTSEQQWSAAGQRITDPTQLAPGDLVFFDPDTGSGLPGHVGIYVGAGQMVDAPHTNAFVRQEPIAGFGTFMGGLRIAS